jgi:hypothetical protein
MIGWRWSCGRAAVVGFSRFRSCFGAVAKGAYSVAVRGKWFPTFSTTLQKTLEKNVISNKISVGAAGAVTH